MTRQDSRQDYRSFPEEYFTLIDRLAALGPGENMALGPMSAAGAQQARREFYRFRGFLRAAEDDPHARQLARHAEAATATLAPAAIADGSLDTILVFTVNPLVAALRAT